MLFPALQLRCRPALPPGMRWLTGRRVVLSLLLLLLSLAQSQPVVADDSIASDAERAGMVEIRQLAPDIDVEMRYAGSDNFTGRPVPGYEASKCYLLRPAADALARVQRTLREAGYGLRVFDCYRPLRSVRSFVVWASDAQDQQNKSRYFPDTEKSALLGSYIAAHSSHSRGVSIDLTLLRCDGERCDAVDMGTEFDFFDPRAHTDSSAVGVAQRDNRQRLRQAMEAAGFRNYPREWWHFTWTYPSGPGTAYDFPIR